MIQTLQRIKASLLGTKTKVFCISMQRNATTSTAQFFRDIGLRTAGWDTCYRNDWSNQES